MNFNIGKIQEAIASAIKEDRENVSSGIKKILDAKSHHLFTLIFKKFSNIISEKAFEVNLEREKRILEKEFSEISGITKSQALKASEEVIKVIKSYSKKLAEFSL